MRLTSEQRACVDFLLITQRRLFGDCEKLRTALFDLFALATGRSHYDLRGEGVSKLAQLLKRTSPVDGAIVHAANVHKDTTIGLLELGRFDIRETISGDLEFTLRHRGKRKRFTVPQLRLAAVESVRAVRAATRGVLETTQDLREQLSPLHKSVPQMSRLPTAVKYRFEWRAVRTADAQTEGFRSLFRDRRHSRLISSRLAVEHALAGPC